MPATPEGKPPSTGKLGPADSEMVPAMGVGEMSPTGRPPRVSWRTRTRRPRTSASPPPPPLPTRARAFGPPVRAPPMATAGPPESERRLGTAQNGERGRRDRSCVAILLQPPPHSTEPRVEARLDRSLGHGERCRNLRNREVEDMMKHDRHSLVGAE